MDQELISAFVPVVLWIGFFAFQVIIKPRELSLVIAAIVFSIITIAIGFNPRELYLLLIGISMGIIIEVALGAISRQQHWEGTSILSVPLWLPIIWGAGFIIMYRVGVFIVG